MTMPTYLTVNEVADLLQFDRKTITRWIQAGKIPGVNFGGKGNGARWRVDATKLQEVIEKKTSRSRLKILKVS